MRFERIDLLVGAVLIGAVGLVAGVGVWLSATAAEPSYPIHTYFDDVDGIAMQAPVRLRGYQIGQVAAITPDVLPDGSLRFRITMSIDRELESGGALRLPAGTRAYLVPPPVPITTAWIELEPAGDGGGTLAAGAEIQGTRRDAAMDQAQAMMTELTRELALTLAESRKLMIAAGGTAEGLQLTMANTNDALPTLLGGLDRQLVATESLTRDMQAHMGRIAPSAATGMDSLTAVLAASHRLLRQMSELADTAMPQVAGILANLDSTSVVLDEFSRQFAKRPVGVLFRGVRPADSARVDSAAVVRAAGATR